MPLAQQTDELSPEEFDAGLIAPQGELTPEAFDAGLQDIKPKAKPKKEAGPLRSFAGSALESLAAVPDFLSISGDILASPGTRSVLSGRTGEEQVQHEQMYSLPKGAPQENVTIPAPMESLAGGIRGAAEKIYPPEQRGQGGFLSEDLPAGLGSMAGSLPAMAMGPGAAALQFGAQNGVPLYYDVKASTGDEEAAMWGLLFGGAVGQLEKFGAEKALGGIVKKLAAPKVATALERAALAAATAGQEAGTEFTQQALTDSLYEALTDEDVAVLENAMQTLPVSLTLGGFAGGLRAALSRRPSEGVEPAKTAEAPGKPQETGTPEVALEPTQAPVAPQAQPDAPGGKTIDQVSLEAQKSVGAAGEVELPPPQADAARRLANKIGSWSEEDKKAFEAAHGGRISAGKLDINISKEEHPDLRLYRGEPRGTETPLRPADGGAAGPGTYFAIHKRKADLFAGQGGEVKEFDAPKARLLRVPANEAINAAEWNTEARERGYDGIWIEGQGEIVLFDAQKTISGESKATGIKNAAVESELEKMGLPLPEKAERRTFVDLHAKAKETFEASKGEAGRELVADLEAKPRPPSDAEDALLTFEANRLVNEVEAAEKAYAKDPTDENKKRVDDAQSTYNRTAAVLDIAGRESGRSLNARKMMLARDYSLAALKRKALVAKKGKPLTEEENKTISELHKRIAASQKALDDYTSAAEVRAKELEARALLAEARLFAKEEARKEGFKGRKKKIEASKKRIDELTRKLGSGTKAAAGLDPEKVVLTAQLAKEYVNLGYQNFRLFADDVVARVGEHIRPYLKTAWEDAQKASDEELLTRYKARKKADIGRVEERKKILPLEKKSRRTPIEKDPEAIELKVEYEAAKRAFERERERIRKENRSKGEKIADLGREILVAPRALKFSFDLPPIFRQAARYAVPDIFFSPKRLATFFAKGTTALHKRTAERIDAEIRSSKLHVLAEAGGLDLPTVEEDQNSWIAQKMPGVAASSRIYNTFMNLYRMSAFEGLLKGIPNPTLEDAKTAARSVNILTGRGNPKGKVGSLVDGLGAVLSSPRLLLSNFQTIAGAPLYRGSWRVRRKVAQQYARTLTGYAALYGMVELVDSLDDEDDLRVEWDPRSSDFGKIIAGEKRFDVMGGISQITTLIGRVATRETKSIGGKVTPIRGPKAQKDALDVGKEFLRWKLSPTFSAGVEVVTGKQAELGRGGRPLPTDAESVAEGLLVPISFEDIYDDMKRHGVEETLALRLIGLIGIGARDYAEGKRP